MLLLSLYSLFLVPQTDPGPATPPRLGKLWVTDPTPNSLHLSWTVPEGQFDSFVVQYRDRDGRPQVLPVEGPERSVTVSPLDPEHKYRFTLFGIANRKRHGPLTADGTTGEWQPPTSPCDPSQSFTRWPSARSQLGLPSEMADSTSSPCFGAQGQPASPTLLGPFHSVRLLPKAQVCHTLAVLPISGVQCSC